MHVVYLVSHSIALGVSSEEDMWSFLAIPAASLPEVADAGHGRCIAQLRAENVTAANVGGSIALCAKKSHGRKNEPY